MKNNNSKFEWYLELYKKYDNHDNIRETSIDIKHDYSLMCKNCGLPLGRHGNQDQCPNKETYFEIDEKETLKWRVFLKIINSTQRR